MSSNTHVTVNGFQPSGPGYGNQNYFSSGGGSSQSGGVGVRAPAKGNRKVSTSNRGTSLSKGSSFNRQSGGSRKQGAVTGPLRPSVKQSGSRGQSSSSRFSNKNSNRRPGQSKNRVNTSSFKNEQRQGE